MVTKNRDVSLNVEIQTAGEESLRKLGAEVRSLAKAGGDAAPQFLQLADEIDRLAAQAAALDRFRTAATGIDEVATASRQAAAEADRLKSALDGQRATLDSLRDTQARIQEQYDKTRTAVSEERKELDLLSASYKAGKLEKSNYAQEAADLEAKLALLKQQQRDLSVELAQSKRATNEAAKEFDQLRTSAQRAAESSQTLGRAYAEQSRAVEDAKKAGAELGVSFDDAAAAQERLDAALRDATGALQATAATEKLRREQRATDAAVTALTDEIDQQAEVVRGKLVTSLQAASDAYEKEQAAIAASIRAAELATVAKKEQAEADRLAALQAQGLAEAQQRGRLAAESELAAIKDSEDFVRRYAAAKELATKQSLEFVLAEEQAAAAADKASRRVAELNATAEQTARREQYVRELAAAFDEVDQQAAQAAAQVQRLQGYFDKLSAERDVVANAFGTTGIRSIQAIEQEMFSLQRALVTLRGELAAGRISIQDFDRATTSAGIRMKTLREEIAKVPGDKSVFEQLASSADDLVTKYGRLTAAIATVGFALKPVLDEFIRLQSTSRILTQVTGSAEEAGKQIEFLRNVAQQAGQQFGEISQSYAKFAASALQAGVSTEQTQAAFKAVALAAGNLGLSSDQAKRALEALSQMASKGTVSMEELRQQLGDALPGVLPLLARQLGLTGQELNKLVESGGLLANEAIPAITVALNQLADQNKQVEGLAASWARFRNVVFEAGTTLVEGPLGRAAGFVLAGVGAALEGLALRAVQASEAIQIVGKTIALTAAALTGNIKSFNEFRNEFAAIVLESDTKVKSLEQRITGAGDATEKFASQAAAATPALTKQADAVSQTATAAQAAAPAQQQLAANTQAAGQAAAAAVPQHQAAAKAVDQVATAAGGASTSMARLRLDYQANIEAAKQSEVISVKNVEARKAEAEAIRSLGSLTGDDTKAKEANAKAAELVSVAEKDRAETAQRIVEVLKARRDAEEALANQQGRNDDAFKKRLAALDDEIEKQQASATAAARAAEASRLQAVQAQLTADAVKNNASRIDDLRLAYIKARQSVDDLVVAQKAGQVSQAVVTAAIEQSAKAQRLYADAISDTAANLKSEADVRRAFAAIQAEGLKVQQAETASRQQAIQVEIEYAKSKNDTLKVAELERKLLDEQIRQKELSATQLRTEAELVKQTATARVQQIDRLVAELTILDQLTPEKARELELERLQQQALLKTADARLAQVKGIDAQIGALKRLRAEQQSVSQTYDRMLQTQLELDRLQGLGGGYLAGVGSQAAVNARNEAISSGSKPIESSFSFGTKSGTIGSYYTPPPDNSGDYEWVIENNRGTWQLSAAGAARREAATRARNDTIREAYRRAGMMAPGDGTAAGLNVMGLPAAVREQLNFGANGPTLREAAPAAAPAQTTRYEVKLSLGGIAQTVAVGSAADAEALRTFFAQLEAAMRRAGGGGP